METRKWIVGGTLLFSLGVVGCDGGHYQHDYSDTITHQQQWDRDDAISADNQRTAGYSGSFACHTADGGCLSMSCATKASCDYMANVQKRCAVPTIKDVQMADRAVVKDDKCESVQTQPVTNLISGGTGLISATNGSGIIACASGQCTVH